MTTAERKRVGLKLKAMRAERNMRQVDVANDPKCEISLGTLQAIESSWYDSRDTSIEKYARYFGTTVKRILQADEPRAVTPNDPLLKDLNEEHLEVARSYMRARKRVRACIEILLNHHAAEEKLTSLFMKLDALAPERLGQIDAIIGAAPDGEHVELLTRIWQRLLTDPHYAALAKENLDVLEQLPTLKPEQKKTRPVPTHRA